MSTDKTDEPSIDELAKDLLEKSKILEMCETKGTKSEAKKEEAYFDAQFALYELEGTEKFWENACNLINSAQYTDNMTRFLEQLESKISDMDDEKQKKVIKDVDKWLKGRLKSYTKEQISEAESAVKAAESTAPRP